MKQHITVEQLANIDDMKDIYFLACLIDVDYWNCEKPFYAISNTLTIGKMIEIINDKWGKDEIFISRLEDFKWQIVFNLTQYTGDIFNDYDFNVESEELVDVLWEALKYILGSDEK